MIPPADPERQLTPKEREELRKLAPAFFWDAFGPTIIVAVAFLIGVSVMIYGLFNFRIGDG